ncbi:unnamed protein product [Caretta caretta]
MILASDLRNAGIIFLLKTWRYNCSEPKSTSQCTQRKRGKSNWSNTLFVFCTTTIRWVQNFTEFSTVTTISFLGQSVAA